jgi:hypothetical protein
MVSRLSPWLLILVFLGLAVAAVMVPLSSDTVPYAFLFDRNEAKNDQQRFLNTVVANSGVSREDLQPVLSKLRPLETQLPTALFIARESGKPVSEIADLRKSSRYWLDVLTKSGLKPKVLFEGVEGKFPEPYKAAWIEYRMKRVPELSDEQVRQLVLLQTAQRVSGQPLEEIVKASAKGRTPEMILARAPEPGASASPAKASASAPPAAKAKDRSRAPRKGGVRGR